MAATVKKETVSINGKTYEIDKVPKSVKDALPEMEYLWLFDRVEYEKRQNGN